MWGISYHTRQPGLEAAPLSSVLRDEAKGSRGILDLSVLQGRDTMPTSPGQEEPKKAGWFQSLAHSVSLHCCGTKC